MMWVPDNQGRFIELPFSWGPIYSRELRKFQDLVQVLTSSPCCLPSKILLPMSRGSLFGRPRERERACLQSLQLNTLKETNSLLSNDSWSGSNKSNLCSSYILDQAWWVRSGTLLVTLLDQNVLKIFTSPQGAHQKVK